MNNYWDRFLNNWLIPLLAFATLCIFLSAQSRAADTETVVEESIYQALHVVDAAQTVYIAKNPDRFYEKESAWAIGAHPTEGKVIQYMAIEAGVHVAVTVALVRLDAPRWLTRTWELVTIGDSARCVGNNYRIGIKASF